MIENYPCPFCGLGIDFDPYEGGGEVECPHCDAVCAVVECWELHDPIEFSEGAKTESPDGQMELF